jgi:hypothetical protein
MQREDVFKTLVCPVWGLAAWRSKDTEKNGGPLYGESPQGNAGAAALIGAILVLVFFILTLCGIIKAFMCGSNPTNLGASGFVWGLLGLFIPLPALIFLFAGRCDMQGLAA